MPKTNIHPDLKKKFSNFTISSWNISIFRFLFKYFIPKGTIPIMIETLVLNRDGIKLRIHKPKNKEPNSVLLWIHGGGLIIGDPSQDDLRCAHFAKELGILVVAAKYRLAPQHSYPAAIDDCFATWSILQKYSKELGIDPQKIAIGGSSAGGGLAANLAIRIRDEGGIQPVGQLLLYPMLDDRTTLRTDIGYKEHLVWNHKSNITGWNAYLGKECGTDHVLKYAAAARHKNLKNLPPAWIGVGTLDLFYDENVDYARRLKENEVLTDLEIINGAYHGFDGIDTESVISKSFVCKMVEFLRSLSTV
jgi:acetyl esterase/lipase